MILVLPSPSFACHRRKYAPVAKYMNGDHVAEGCYKVIIVRIGHKVIFNITVTSNGNCTRLSVSEDYMYWERNTTIDNK